MSDFADKLIALGLKSSGDASSSPIKKVPAVGSLSVAEEALFFRLPFFGVVSRIEEDRGFGFIRTADRNEVFFHFRGFSGRLPNRQKLPPVRTHVLFTLGSSPRRPGDFRKEAAAWAPVDFFSSLKDDPPGNQASLDVLRRVHLHAKPMRALWEILEASWYAKRWGPEAAAPTDLEDGILQEVVYEQLAALSPTELKEKEVVARLAESRYRFAANLASSNKHHAYSDALKIFDVEQLAALGTPDIFWVQRRGQLPAIRQKILEWFLLSSANLESRDEWKSLFPGTGASEVKLATRLLESGTPRDSFMNAWLHRIACNRLLSKEQAEVWINYAPELTSALFSQLKESRRAALLSDWRADPDALNRSLVADPHLARLLLSGSALSLDLETDGEHVWEIGCAHGGEISLLHDERAGTDQAAAWAALEKKIREAPLVIGHNVIAWDWPIASRYLNLDRSPLIWDTLLVQFLLEPQAHTHALGGNHRADDDALAAVRLFQQQFDRLPPDLARDVLMGAFTSSEQLVAAIAGAIEGSVSYAREPPAYFTRGSGDSSSLLIAPARCLRELDWVPGTIISSADPEGGVGIDWKQVSFTLLEAELQDAEPSLRESAAARTVLEVVRNADRQGIALRRNMLPLWLVEPGGALEVLINLSCVTPADIRSVRCAVLPDRSDWWLESAADTYKIAGVSQDVLILDRRVLPINALGPVGVPSRGATFMRKDSQDGRSVWCLVDRAANVLSPRGGLRSFRTMRIDPGVERIAEAANTSLCKPVIAKRRSHVLYPHAEDQVNYWIDLLRTFSEVSIVDDGTVPALLIGSSRSAELLSLLQTALAELELGETRPVHRSRREHLRRAQRRGLAIVVLIDDWPAWKTEARMAGISLRPVVEALPVEEWYAATKAELPQEKEASIESEQLAVVDTSWILEALPELVKSNLTAWLSDMHLDDSDVPTTIIDPRLNDAVRGSVSFANIMTLTGSPLATRYLRRLEVVFSPFKVLREDAPASMDVMERFLVEKWQPPNGSRSDVVTGFKQSQRAPMEAIVERTANVLISLPTGEGKSVLFQVPALCRGLRNRRLTLVLSPLKALMADQVKRLQKHGFAESVDYLNSDRSPYEIDGVIQGVLDHRIVLLYVAPERLRSEVFLDVLAKRMQADSGLEHVVVDETHCVNQWGYEFRPDYFHALSQLLDLCERMGRQNPTPFLLLSATTTASDRACLQAILSGGGGGPSSPLPLLRRPDELANPIRSHIVVETHRARGSPSEPKEFEKALAERLPLMEKVVAISRENRAKTGQRSAVLVFVSRRSHAERVAQELFRRLGGGIDFYHGGLQSETRDEIYSDFLNGGLDVLVATKAFGMGMDIPDIHSVIHFSPPGYLEDYLQEAGRIGRGVKERERAGLKQLTALLLYSDRDFESIRTMRSRSALSLPAIKELYSSILSGAQAVDGQRIAIVPSDGYDEPEGPFHFSETKTRGRETKTRMSLYWLERADALEICGSVPGLIGFSINPAVLQRLTQRDGSVAEAARLILKIDAGEQPSTQTLRSAVEGLFDEEPEQCVSRSDGGAAAEQRYAEFNDVTSNEREGALVRLLRRISESIGVSTESSGIPDAPSVAGVEATATRPYVQRVTHRPRSVILNLSWIKAEDALPGTIDDILSDLADLERLGAIELGRKVHIVRRKLADEPKSQIDALFNYVDGATEELIRRVTGNDGILKFNPFELVEDVDGPTVLPELQAIYEKAFINGFRNLARSTGIRMRQVITDDEKTIWEAVLPPSSFSEANQKRKRVIRGARLLLAAIGQDQSIEISRVIEKLKSANPTTRFRERNLKHVAGLLAVMNLVEMSADLIPLSYVVVLPGGEGAIDLDTKPEVWEELRKVNELAEIRNLAMEVFANIPAQARTPFISGYFAAADAQAIRLFLDNQLGEILRDDIDESTSSVIGSMLEQLRATKVAEFFKRFEESEEPAQWEVVRHPFDGHILVNAGPGAGKTFVLVGRIAHLIRHQNIDPSQIIVLAFNRAVVFEIRRRIRELFKSLGYAAYATRLRVSTFHSFAMSNMRKFGNVDFEEKSLENILKDFADLMFRDGSFRQKVVGNTRCILVDEYQDVTYDVYSVVKQLYLGSGSKAGVMVIGDDDQDILRWQRLGRGEYYQFSKIYFTKFEEDFSVAGLSKFVLKKNFRSDRLIVESSQRMISNCLKSDQSTLRIKSSPLVARDSAQNGVCEGINWRGKNWEQALDRTAQILANLHQSRRGSIAILCRTNAEVAEAHRRLAPVVPGLMVQGGANPRVADLRHVALWLDCLRERIADDDMALSAALRADVQRQFDADHSIPEVRKPETVEVHLDELWSLCVREQAFPYLSDLVHFVESLRVDEYGRMTSMNNPMVGAVVTTLHKAKGLEFDSVLILPSTLEFGTRSTGRTRIDVADDAAEEARLLYVGLTRAKHRLWYFVGDREYAWARRQTLSQVGERKSGIVLEGGHSEVQLSWALTPRHVELQRYIETEIAVGDKIVLGGVERAAGRILMHQSAAGRWTPVGQLAKGSGSGGENASLKVSAVVRFKPEPDDPRVAQEFHRRGWGYVVLVAGRLR